MGVGVECDDFWIKDCKGIQVIGDYDGSIRMVRNDHKSNECHYKYLCSVKCQPRGADRAHRVTWCDRWQVSSSTDTCAPFPRPNDGAAAVVHRLAQGVGQNGQK